jgi:hypothetical protein
MIIKNRSYENKTLLTYSIYLPIIGYIGTKL